MLDIFLEFYPLFLRGLGVTVFVTIISCFSGTILGTFLALGKIYGNKFVSAVVRIFISIIRGTPLLVQLFIIYYGLPAYGIRLTPITAAVISFIINSGAYQAEYLRGSIQSISGSQLKAAQSIGMSKWQGIRYIILPQALRRVIPAWTNEFIYMIKYSSLAYVIGARELMTEGKLIASRNYQFFNVYFIVALIYLVVIILFVYLFNRIEKKVTIP
ncbi:amino acid ABC transporter membrane protein 2 (PAAT family) [Halanaerobium saccharolyticum]|jgi:polar amino acid transport system permease protein|uniref:Amino acid ABC transporter membrane protein 2 (PAAT family) n=1 Tax=Halanaerobium saccharolyticum TaxID=43595 RepID=A0A4R6RPR8_9FIRM|nr:amino acid ABC transporter permease [Halanaerobium saccharolyticum]TDP88753.1 amino acid ABC transporter membrane protein 2 (PAAT family) [Halanaerobium saccharolyticum]